MDGMEMGRRTDYLHVDGAGVHAFLDLPIEWGGGMFLLVFGRWNGVDSRWLYAFS